MSQTEKTSYELLSGGVELLTDEERDLTYYNMSLGYNLLPGQIYISDRWAFNTRIYLIAGVGNTDFGAMYRDLDPEQSPGLGREGRGVGDGRRAGGTGPGVWIEDRGIPVGDVAWTGRIGSSAPRPALSITIVAAAQNALSGTFSMMTGTPGSLWKWGTTRSSNVRRGK